MEIQICRVFWVLLQTFQRGSNTHPFQTDFSCHCAPSLPVCRSQLLVLWKKHTITHRDCPLNHLSRTDTHHFQGSHRGTVKSAQPFALHRDGCKLHLAQFSELHANHLPHCSRLYPDIWLIHNTTVCFINLFCHYFTVITYLHVR